MQPQSIVSAIAEELDLTELPPEEQTRIIHDLAEVALRSITLAVLAAIPDHEHERFGRAAREGSAEFSEYFIRKYVPDYDALCEMHIKETLDNFLRLRAYIGHEIVRSGE